MEMPKYLMARLANGSSTSKDERAANAYKSKMIRLGILPDSDFWHFFVDENIVTRSCQLDLVVNLKGSCSISFVFPRQGPSADKVDRRFSKVRFTFYGVGDLECCLFDNGKCRERKFLSALIWERKHRFGIRIELTSDRHGKNSSIAFSYSYVLNEYI